MKSTNKKKKKNTLIIFIFLLFLLIPFLFSHLISRQYLQSVKTRAEEDDADFCKNHCTPSHGNEPDCRGKPDFYDEECCLRIQQTGDPSECPWPQRGWCMPEHCATIPEGVNRLRCAAPRESWCNMCKERGCFKNVSPTNVPIITFFPSPTEIVDELTQIPTIESTKPISPRHIFPTITVPFLSTKRPISILPTNPPVELKLPKIIFPTIKVNFEEIKTKTDYIVEKPAGFFQWMLLKIKYYDQLLEDKINKQVKIIFNF